MSLIDYMVRLDKERNDATSLFPGTVQGRMAHWDAAGREFRKTDLYKQHLEVQKDPSIIYNPVWKSPRMIREEKEKLLSEKKARESNKRVAEDPEKIRKREMKRRRMEWKERPNKIANLQDPSLYSKWGNNDRVQNGIDNTIIEDRPATRTPFKLGPDEQWRRGFLPFVPYKGPPIPGLEPIRDPSIPYTRHVNVRKPEDVKPAIRAGRCPSPDFTPPSSPSKIPVTVPLLGNERDDLVARYHKDLAAGNSTEYVKESLFTERCINKEWVYPEVRRTISNPYRPKDKRKGSYNPDLNTKKRMTEAERTDDGIKERTVYVFGFDPTTHLNDVVHRFEAYGPIDSVYTSGADATEETVNSCYLIYANPVHAEAARGVHEYFSSGEEDKHTGKDLVVAATREEADFITEEYKPVLQVIPAKVEPQPEPIPSYIIRPYLEYRNRPTISNEPAKRWTMRWWKKNAFNLVKPY